VGGLRPGVVEQVQDTTTQEVTSAAVSAGLWHVSAGHRGMNRCGDASMPAVRKWKGVSMRSWMMGSGGAEADEGGVPEADGDWYPGYHPA
jgi:hypothetical protein